MLFKNVINLYKITFKVDIDFNLELVFLVCTILGLLKIKIIFL